MKLGCDEQVPESLLSLQSLYCACIKTQDDHFGVKNKVKTYRQDTLVVSRPLLEEALLLRPPARCSFLSSFDDLLLDMPKPKQQRWH
eukprot:11776-Eustigmatos_ZCMA.PRE.1